MQTLDELRQLVTKLARGVKGGTLTPRELLRLPDLELLFPQEPSADGSLNRIQRRYRQTTDEVGLQYCVADLPLSSQGTNLAAVRGTLGAQAQLEPFVTTCMGVTIRANTEATSNFMPIYPGWMWALRAFGAIRPDKAQVLKLQPIRDGSLREVFVRSLKAEISVGEPSNELLPFALRASLSTYLTKTLGIRVPKVMVLTPAGPGEVPRLVYNCFPEDAALRANRIHREEQIFARLHPSPYVVTIYPHSNKDLEDYMIPLEQPSPAN